MSCFVFHFLFIHCLRYPYFLSSMFSLPFYFYLSSIVLFLILCFYCLHHPISPFTILSLIPACTALNPILFPCPPIPHSRLLFPYFPIIVLFPILLFSLTFTFIIFSSSSFLSLASFIPSMLIYPLRRPFPQPLLRPHLPRPFPHSLIFSSFISSFLFSFIHSFLINFPQFSFF